jgi:ribosomal-protein-alanine N-acetyltransferase
MTAKHLEQVHAIERESFAIPWSLDAFKQELTENKVAIYIVASIRRSGSESPTARLLPKGSAPVIGYAGMWHVVTEGHITNIAVAPEFRKQGVGSALLSRLCCIAQEKGMIGLTLEVRVGNRNAMNLYHKYGFKVEGIRKNYYADTHEDAIIMWKHL